MRANASIHSHRDLAKVRPIRNEPERRGHHPLLFFLKCLEADDARLPELIREDFSAESWVVEHLDSKTAQHHDARMRTTVTLDRDVELMLRNAMHRSRRSFKETLNAALRAGLGEKTPESKCAPFVVEARSMGLRAGFDPAGFNKLADELEVEAFAAKSRRPKGA